MITSKEDFVKTVIKEYYKYDQELSSFHFDFQVDMPKEDILSAFAEVERCANGDTVVRLSNEVIDHNGNVCGAFIHECFFEAGGEKHFKGNAKDFLEAFNDREKETGFYRIIDAEIDSTGYILMSGTIAPQFIW